MMKLKFDASTSQILDQLRPQNATECFHSFVAVEDVLSKLKICFDEKLSFFATQLL